MPKFEVKYHIREPVSRHPQSGAFKYQRDGTIQRTITVSATDATDARKKTARHPNVLRDKEKANTKIDSTVLSYGGKARHKVDDVKAVKSETKTKAKASRLSGKGGGGTLNSPIKKLADGSGLSGPLRRKMNKGGIVKKKVVGK